MCWFHSLFQLVLASRLNCTLRSETLTISFDSCFFSLPHSKEQVYLFISLFKPKIHVSTSFEARQDDIQVQVPKLYKVSVSLILSRGVQDATLWEERKCLRNAWNAGRVQIREPHLTPGGVITQINHRRPENTGSWSALHGCEKHESSLESNEAEHTNSLSFTSTHAYAIVP